MSTEREIPVDGQGVVPVRMIEAGNGQPFLLLHGGGGPLTVAGFAEMLADAPAMADSGLARRLGAVTKPTLVVWGESDRIADPDYGRAMAGAIPHAQFLLLPAAGHLPQIEQPSALMDVVWKFAQTIQ